jgi:hypothetical protein
MAGEPEQAREASHRHLAFIEEILLDRSREQIASRTLTASFTATKGLSARFLERGN